MSYFNRIKKLIDIEINQKSLSVTEKLRYAERAADIIFLFTNFNQITKTYIDCNKKVSPSYGALIFFSEANNINNVESKNIASQPIMIFTYFILRASLKENSHDAHLEYGFKIFFNNNCSRFYNRDDLILNFYDFYDEFSSALLPKTVSSYYKCPAEININPSLYSIFYQYVHEYTDYMKRFLCDDKPYYKGYFDPMSCKMFAIYDYPILANQDIVYSEESHILAYEVCMNMINFISEHEC